jgi:hypothetical protein
LFRIPLSGTTYRKPKTLTGACESVDSSTCELSLQVHLWRRKPTTSRRGRV